jgi:hypothetical protein
MDYDLRLTLYANELQHEVRASGIFARGTVFREVLRTLVREPVRTDHARHGSLHGARRSVDIHDCKDRIRDQVESSWTRWDELNRENARIEAGVCRSLTIALLAVRELHIVYFGTVETHRRSDAGVALEDRGNQGARWVALGAILR